MNREIEALCERDGDQLKLNVAGDHRGAVHLALHLSPNGSTRQAIFLTTEAHHR